MILNVNHVAVFEQGESIASLLHAGDSSFKVTFLLNVVHSHARYLIEMVFNFLHDKIFLFSLLSHVIKFRCLYI
jgi:hypothetical protein